jgi:hypothetical protein
VGEAPAPALRTVPSKIVLDSARAVTPVTLMGDHFDADVSIRLSSPLHVMVYGPSSFDLVGPTTLRFNAAGLQDGEYSISVRSSAGQRSNEMTVTVKHQK